MEPGNKWPALEDYLEIWDEEEGNRREIKVGDKLYDINLDKMPYFQAFVRFQIRTAQNTHPLIHGPIKHFDAAWNGSEFGWRKIFRILGPVGLPVYQELFQTLQFLCMNPEKFYSISQILESFTECQYHSRINHKSYFKYPGDRLMARNSAFRLLHLILGLDEREVDEEETLKILDAVAHVTVHRITFSRTTRKVILEACKEKMHLRTRQLKNLDLWVGRENRTDSDDEKSTSCDSFAGSEYTDSPRPDESLDSQPAEKSDGEGKEHSTAIESPVSSKGENKYNGSSKRHCAKRIGEGTK